MRRLAAVAVLIAAGAASAKCRTDCLSFHRIEITDGGATREAVEHYLVRSCESSVDGGIGSWGTSFESCDQS